MHLEFIPFDRMSLVHPCGRRLRLFEIWTSVIASSMHWAVQSPMAVRVPKVQDTVSCGSLLFNSWNTSSKAFRLIIHIHTSSYDQISLDLFANGERDRVTNESPFEASLRIVAKWNIYWTLASIHLPDLECMTNGNDIINAKKFRWDRRDL